MRKIVFRADGNSKMGLGHIVRSLALAEMLMNDFIIYFASKTQNKYLIQQIKEYCEFIQIPQGLSVEQELNLVCQYFSENDIVVLDGYHFDTPYQKTIKKKGVALVSIDDIHHCHFVSDIVINHAGGIKESDYSAELYTKFFLGLKYSLLRQPFRKAAKNKGQNKNKKGHLFISLGGADPNNDLIRVLKYCEPISTIKQCYIVVGSAYKYYNELSDLLTTTKLPITLLQNLSAEEMVKYMQLCPMAITPPSTVAYEYLSVGGELFLTKIAPNQNRMYNYFINYKFCYDIHQLKDDNRKKLRSPIELDGQQRERFVSLFQQL